MKPPDDDLSITSETLDPFAPSRVDETIAAAMTKQGNAPVNREVQLAQTLAAVYTLPANADAAIERVRQRLAAAPLTQVPHLAAESAPTSPMSATPARSTLPHRFQRLRSVARSMAAVLMVALLVGGFIALLHGRQENTTSSAHSPTVVVQAPTVPEHPTQQPRHECAGDPETTAAIQPGGLGALGTTFAARWGGVADVALGTTYFGRYRDTGQGIVSVPSTALAPGARVPSLTYHVDSTAHVTLTRAKTIAATILPTDVHPIYNGAPPGTNSPIMYTYCSAAFWAAFPPPSPNVTYGELAATYYLRSDGTVDYIDFSPAVLG
jgi:hypothetical protein